MKRSGIAKRLLAMALIITLLLGLAMPVGATGGTENVIYPTFTQVDNSEVTAEFENQADLEEEPLYADTDMVRVSIVLERKSTLEAGFSTQSIGSNTSAMQYRQGLQNGQRAMTASIEKNALGGQRLDVVWNLTLAANIISANVPYGKIGAIQSVPGVREVVLEKLYEPAVVSQEEGTVSPNMAVSAQMNGTNTVWEMGYTGAGTRIAIIDTGLDTDHQSFSPEAFDYAIAENAKAAGQTPEAYMEARNFLDAEEIARVMGQLNAARRYPEASAEDFYVSTKVPFGYNYIDTTLNITHDEDMQGSHGSHVAGIAAANRYIPQGEGYAEAATAVHMVGNAPDAQLIVMKVFGVYGGAYDSDYFAAIEDAIVLGCDSVNLSLGSADAGMTTNDVYQGIMDELEKTDTVVTMSAGNNGNWAEHSNVPNLYAEDVNLDTAGAPASYTNSLAVASADNDGAIGSYLQLGDRKIVYTDTLTGRRMMSKMDTTGTGTEYEYLLIEGVGKAEDYAGMDLTGKIVFCSRGDTNFADKANVANRDLGAAGLVVYNNQPGSISMNLSGYSARQPQPAVSITQADGIAVRDAGTAHTTEGGLTYYTGTISVHAEFTVAYYDSFYRSISSFSSWGVPGDLSMKPEITAPGGNIYSVNGVDWSGTAYEFMSGTSMAAPQVAGMAALVKEYIREQKLHQEGMTDRALAQSLLMSTAVPLMDEASGNYHSILRQGAGLAAVDKAVSAPSYLTVEGQPDGKVKAELKDDPERTGEYTFAFAIHDLSGQDFDYILSADLFTQGVFEGYLDQDETELGLYMDTLTESMDALASFRADGKAVVPVADLTPYDYNGDGKTDLLDAQLLMDHVLGTAALEADTDVNGDGATTSLDVHQLLKMLGSGIVTVPANGSVTVEVTLTLTEAQKEALDDAFENGAYVEGFVRVAPAATAEGLLAPVHTIPVLGFYGNWSDPSMFDKGCTQLFDTGEMPKQHYVVAFANALVTRHKGSRGQYYVAGNPVVTDETYMEERNAWSNTRGSVLDAMAMTLIRNAGSSRVTVANAGTGELLLQQETGSASAAFYYSGTGFWYNTNTQFPLNYTAEGVAEGTRLAVTIEAAPELYVAEDGTTDWDALGKGASYTTSFTIDNTAPEILEISYNLLSNTMTVYARDNFYVAGARLYNSGGFVTYGVTGSNQEEAGEVAELTLDLTDVNGDLFLLRVVDYAGNATVYRVDMAIGTPGDAMDAMAYEMYSGLLVSFNMGGPNSYTPSETMTGLADPGDVIYAAADVQGLMYASTQGGDLYVIDEAHPEDMRYVGNLGLRLTDLAYNRQDGKLYGITQDSEIYTVDTLTAQLAYVATVPFPANTLAADDAGNFYVIVYGIYDDGTYQSGSLCRFTLETVNAPEVVYSTWKVHDGVQSLAWNPNTGCVCWAMFYEFWSHGNQFQHIYNDIVCFDPETGSYYYEFISRATLTTMEYCRLTGLIFPEKGVTAQWPEEASEVSGVRLTEAATLIPGESKPLTAAVTPWNATDRTVTWSSSNPEVATVDENGNVTAKAPGTATITATSRLDPSKSADCTVTVERPQVRLTGIVENATGENHLFTWDLSQGETWNEDSRVDVAVGSAALDTANNKLYVSNSERDEHREFATYQVDPTTGEITGETSAGLPNPLWDMVYLDYFSTADNVLTQGIYGPYILAPMDPMKPVFNNADLSEALYNGGASNFVAAASAGHATFYSGLGTLDANLVYVLDDVGNIWTAFSYQYYGDWYITLAANLGRNEYIPTDLSMDLTVTGDRTNVSMWCDRSTGTLYLSYYTGTDTEIWRLTYNDLTVSYESTLLTTMKGVGPVRLYDGENLDPDAAGEAVTDTYVATRSLEFETVESLENLPTGTLNAASAALPQEARPEADPDVVKVALTVPEDGTNGMVEFTYDPEKMTLESISGKADVTRWVEDGSTVTLGYAWAEEVPAGTAFAELTFRTKTVCSTELPITFLERNQLTEAYNATLPLDFGHRWSDWTVTELPGCFHEGTETRTCPRCGETETRAIPADSQNCPSKAFRDLDTGKWYHEAVDYVLDAGLMEGIGGGRFAPNLELTRGQLVTILYRMAGEPEVSGTCSFTDVAENRYYYSAIVWAAEKGIAKGMGGNLFAPNQPVTREQMVTFFARYAALQGEVITAQKDLTGFADGSTVSAFARTAMAWAVENGIVLGMGENRLEPKGTATRAQAAQIIQRLCTLLK